MNPPKQTRWTCLHCGYNHRWKYDPWYTEHLETRPFACECNKCFNTTVVQMIKPGLYKSIRKHKPDFSSWKQDPIYLPAKVDGI